MSLNPHFPSPAPTPDNLNTPGAPFTEMDQSAVRSEVERQLLRLSQDLYEMEICAGDVGQGMEGAVPGYMAKINESFKILSDLSGRMTDSVPKQVIEKIDGYGNPHVYTKTTLTRATGENQYALGRMLGLELPETTSLAAANAAHVPTRFLHICAGAYLTVRSVYNLAYIFIDDPVKSYVRTACFLSGVGSCLALCIRAAQANTRVPW